MKHGEDGQPARALKKLKDIVWRSSMDMGNQDLVSSILTVFVGRTCFLEVLNAV